MPAKKLKKRNAPDLTLRNAHAYGKRLTALERDVKALRKALTRAARIATT